MFTVSLLGKPRCAPYTILTDGCKAPEGLKIQLQNNNSVFSASVQNQTNTSCQLREIRLFEFELTLPPSTAFYGEGYTMLSQSGGCLGEITDIGSFTDHSHYRLPEPEGFRTVYGMMTLSPASDTHILLGFSSCQRFTGRFHVNASQLIVSIDMEGLTISPGEQWQLEEFTILVGKTRPELLTQFGQMITSNHPRLPWKARPTGWCSWYWYWDQVTASDINQNLDAINTAMPKQLSYIQIDDGYQPWMGDWLEPNEQFSEGITKLSHDIADKGFIPAIWAAPFIASPQSKLFHTHPDWFIKDSSGQPLASDTVTFGGWRQAPWYMLDGTHPEAQKHLEHVFRTMTQQWGIRYFKLDANVWGALPFGHRYNPNASSVEAYRQGMAAVLRGAGDDSFILACNHAMWPSLGTVHGVRTSGDIMRDWKAFTHIARENLARSWQNSHIWWVDPDCMTLIGPDGCELTADEYTYHVCATIATGGLLLSGDNTALYTPQQWSLLHRLLEIPSIAAQFDRDNRLGWIRGTHVDYALLLNPSDQPIEFNLDITAPKLVYEMINDVALGRCSSQLHYELPAHSGRILRLSNA